ncbi:MAG: LLM class F420-dependent oxidoreductase [Proteobacteria bacterium]|nr:MAG: LLM class F420-dependent oxidoreductase [Pseudomonadota bacterium]
MQFVIPTAFSPASQLAEMAVLAEQNGIDAVAISDHVAHPETIASRYPYTKDGGIRWTEDTAWPDPWVTIGAMAAVTTGLRFVTNVYVLALRNAFVAAKTIATAAALSGDRVALGVGVGWCAEEFALAGQDFRTRGARTDEMIEVLRKLWSGAYVEHHGRFHDFGRVRMLPAPAAPIPIYGGGLSEPALRRAARLDGWISDLHSTAELREIADTLRRYRADCGRAGEPFHLIAACTDAFDAGAIQRLEEIGVTHYATAPWILYGGKWDSLPDKRDGLRRFADEVIAKLRP